MTLLDTPEGRKAVEAAAKAMTVLALGVHHAYPTKTDAQCEDEAERLSGLLRADLLAEVQRLRGERDELKGLLDIALDTNKSRETLAGIYAQRQLASLRASHAEVVKAVREWQEARKAKREYDFPICYDFGADPVGSAVIQREKDAEAALTAFDLGKEGADA